MIDLTPTITVDSLIAVIDNTYHEFDVILEQFGTTIDAEPDANGWTPRQLLSHVIGTWQRAPLQAGFFLTNAKEIPVIFHDPFWIPEYANAPLPAFRAALIAAAEGIKAYLRSLSAGDIDRTLTLPDWGRPRWRPS
jgi:hypothetical protein